MCKNLISFFLPGLALLFYSCSSIEVGEGPFSIEFDENNIQGKKEFLNSFSDDKVVEERPNILLILVDDLGRDDI